MTNEEHYKALIERYKRNNVDLAISLNERRNELREANDCLLVKCRELQEKKDEIINLKQQLAERDAQLALWRTTMIEVFQTNTKQYARLMGMIGCNAAAAAPAATTSSATASAASGPIRPTPPAALAPVRPTSLGAKTTNSDKLGHIEINRPQNNMQIQQNPVDRRRSNYRAPAYEENHLSNLTEESSQNGDSSHNITSFSDIPESNSSTPRSSRKSSRLSKSLNEIDTSPNSPPQIKITKIASPKQNNAKKKKNSKQKTQNLTAEKENFVNGAEIIENGKELGNRPRRRAAPLKLKEPKMNVKLRRPR